METLGHDEATIRVRQVNDVWLAGGTVTSDDGGAHITVRCGRGGVIKNTRARAILWMLYEFAQRISDMKNFEKARAILREIEESNQPKLF